MAFTRDLSVFSGNASEVLTRGVCAHLEIEPGRVMVNGFSDGEIKIQIGENVRGRDVFIINSTCPPVNENLMALLIAIDAARRASAGRITAVMPYFGYARQDRKDKARVPITAKLVANLIVAAGADRVISVDLHCGQIQGFFDIPVDHLAADRVFERCLSQEGLPAETMVVSPDTGSVARAREFANDMGVRIAIVDKRRPKANESEVMNIIGDVNGQHCIILDDMIDTAGTLVKAAQALKDNGALSVRACATHPVFSGPAVDRLTHSAVDKLYVCDSIPLTERVMSALNVKVLSLAPLIGEAIRRIHKDESVSSLFER